jgi:hypothetical protein
MPKLLQVFLCVQASENVTSEDIKLMLTDSPKAKEYFDKMGLVVFSANAGEISNEEFLGIASHADNFPEV